MTLEATLPRANIALIVDVETDNRKRSAQELRADLKRGGATLGPTAFLFRRLGRVVFEGRDTGPGVDDIMDAALDAGARDLDADEHGDVVVWTEPSATAAVVGAVAAPFGLGVLRSDIVWSPVGDTSVLLGDEEAAVELGELLERLRTYPEVQGLYANVTRGAVSDLAWAKIEDNLDL